MTAVLETDLLDVRLGDDGDLFVGPDGFEMTSGPEGVAQVCRIAVRLVLGEWFLNQARGIDWFAILQEKFRSEDVSTPIRQALAGAPGVTAVVSVGVSPPDRVDRRARVTAVVRSDFGDVEISVSVGGTRG